MVLTFIGHSSIRNCNQLSEKIRKAIVDNTKTDDEIIFYCGGYGDFDNLCAKVCNIIKEERPNSETIFVSPYISKTHQAIANPHLYDLTLYPPLETVPLRFAISKRNEWMIDRADLVIAYIDHTFGGAYKSFCYARRKKKIVINIAS